MGETGKRWLVAGECVGAVAVARLLLSLGGSAGTLLWGYLGVLGLSALLWVWRQRSSAPGMRLPNACDVRAVLAGMGPALAIKGALSWLNWRDWQGGLAVAAVALLGAALAAWLLRRDTTAHLPLVLAALPLLVMQAGRGAMAMRVAYTLLVALAEELLFRGYVQGRLATAWKRRKDAPWWRLDVGTWGSATLFGLWHLPAIDAEGVMLAWPWACWTLALGLLLGTLRQRSQGLVAPALLHWLINV